MTSHRLRKTVPRKSTPKSASTNPAARPVRRAKKSLAPQETADRDPQMPGVMKSGSPDYSAVAAAMVTRPSRWLLYLLTLKPALWIECSSSDAVRNVAADSVR